MRDNRGSRRKPLAAEVECYTSNACIKGHIKNIGTLGVFVETDTPLWVGSHLRLVFDLLEGEQIETQGVVAHRQTGKGMGVAFVSIGAEEVKRISKYVDSE